MAQSPSHLHTTTTTTSVANTTAYGNNAAVTFNFDTITAVNSNSDAVNINSSSASISGEISAAAIYAPIDTSSANNAAVTGNSTSAANNSAVNSNSAANNSAVNGNNSAVNSNSASASADNSAVNSNSSAAISAVNSNSAANNSAVNGNTSAVNSTSANTSAVNSNSSAASADNSSVIGNFTSAVNSVSGNHSATTETFPSFLQNFITAANLRDLENSAGRSGTMSTTAIAEEKKSKRARRVSFAEMTSVHFFDRDEYETNSTNSTNSEGSAKVENRKDEREEEGEESEKEESEYEEEEEGGGVGGFLKVMDFSSPGSNLGSATSNEGGEGDFFGPVSTSFIKPGRLSGSATSDDNHDITMDSTAFSMNFRSLARSDYGEELKTPTRIDSPESTPNQTTLGSSMVLTAAEKPSFKIDLHVANVSGGSESSDMSLEKENSRKYAYDRLLSNVDDKVSEVENMLPVNLVLRDRESSYMNVEVENSHKYESSRQLPMVDDVLVGADKDVKVNINSGNSCISGSPGLMRKKLLHLEEQGKSPMEYNYQMQTALACVHTDVVIDHASENQMDDANGGSRASDVLHSSGLVAHCSVDAHPSSNISVDNAIVSPNMDKTAVNSKKTVDFSAPSWLTGQDWDTELIESNGTNQHGCEPLLLELRSPPSEQNKSIMDTSTPSKYSLLVTPQQKQNAEPPQSRNSSIQKSIAKLEKLKNSSLSSHRYKKFSDSYIDHLEPPETALSFHSHSRKFLDRQETLLNNDKLCSPLRQEESRLIHPMELDASLTIGMITSDSRNNLSKDAVEAIPGSASLASCRNLTDSKIQKNLLECFEKSPSKQYTHDVNVLGGKHQSEMESFPSMLHLTEKFRDTPRKRRNDYEIKSEDNSDKECLTMKSPKLQKIGSNDEVPGCPNEAYAGAYTSGQELKKWTDIYAKFSEDAERLLTSAADNLSSHDIDMTEDALASLQRSKSYRVLCDGILMQRTSTSINRDTQRIVKARSLLQKILYERAKSQLMRLKRAKLQDKLQHLTSGLLDSKMLKSCLSLQHFPIVAPAGTVVNKDGKEVTDDRVTALLQHLEDSNNKIVNSLKKLQLSCKVEVGQSHEDTLALAKEHLLRRMQCRSIRLDMQIWDVHATESRNGHRIFILSYLGFVIQRVKVNAGPDSSIAIINKVDDTEVSKKLPNMDALTAFQFVLNNEYSRKYVGLRSLAQETQVTSSVMRSLLDVVEEVQQAQIEIKNLTWTSFCSLSGEQLGLHLCFLNFKTARKLTLTLNISCLKRGIYPSEVSPSELAADRKGNPSVEQVQILEIKNAVQSVRPGYMRILRLCRCISQAVQNLVQ